MRILAYVSNMETMVQLLRKCPKPLINTVAGAIG